MSQVETPHVYKANALIEASYRLSLYEQRVILACISQVRRDQPITDQVFYSVTAAQIADVSGIDASNAYRILKTAAERLFDRRVTLYQQPNGGGQVTTQARRWVQACDYMPSEGRVQLRFSLDILPYLTELTEQFTYYALSDVARMTSSYGIRIYELLMQWMGNRSIPGPRTREVSISWLRDALQMDGKYPALKDFKKWVIDPAVSQINEMSPLKLSWEQRKTGRKVTHLKFTFEDLADRAAASDEEAPAKALGKACKGEMLHGLPRAMIEDRAHPGESYEQAAKRIKAQIARARQQKQENA